MLSESSYIRTFTGMLVCRIANSEFCFDMKDLVKIVDPPDNGEFGKQNWVIEFGGIIFQIIHINRIYKLHTTLSKTSKMILLDIDGKSICFLVDEVLEMIVPNEKSFESLVFVTSNESYLKGTLEYEGRKILVPSMPNIIDLS